MIMKQPTTSFLQNESGMPAIEFALILPFLCFLYFGLIDVTGLISFNRKITASAGATADLVAQQRTDILKPTVQDYYNATYMIMSPTPSADVRVELYGFRTVGATITKIWQTNNGKGPACGAVPSTASMGPLMVSGNDVVVARTCMNWTPYVSTFLGTNILGATTFMVSQSISVRPRSSLTITCYETTKAAGTVCS
jgi:Flp pilus assembly protein TadG